MATSGMSPRIMADAAGLGRHVEPQQIAARGDINNEQKLALLLEMKNEESSKNGKDMAANATDIDHAIEMVKAAMAR